MTDEPRISQRRTRLVVLVCLVLAAGLAVTSLLDDSVTFDETFHLAAGASHLATGDFRLASDHPPLARVWAALPLMLISHEPLPTDDPAWTRSEFDTIGRRWLFVLNDAERLIVAPRLMIVLTLLATCLTVFATARTLFGTGGGLLALLAASLSPTLLAHGRLVTTDLPAALFALLTLLAFDRLLARMTVLRLLAATAATAALALSKLSWPLVVPALVVIATVRVLGRSPLPAFGRAVTSRSARFVVILGTGLVIAAVAWGAIWAAHGFQYSPFRGSDRDRATLIAARGLETAPANMTEAWEAILTDHDGQRMDGAVVAFIDVARERRLLPEAYLYAIAFANRHMQRRSAFLRGRLSETGFRMYFPVAFALKTPIPILLLIVASLAAIVTRRAAVRRAPALFAGLATFLVVFAVSSITSHINIGHRHILPMYPMLLVLLGGAAAWWSWRPARWGGLALLVWLVGANLWVYPHYLSYFNEIAGGPGRGHRWLTDSNVDWGQDLERLARYASKNDERKIRLAYFGSAMPEAYGLRVSDLGSTYSFFPRAPLTAGTYVVSVTQLTGVYHSKARDEFWESARNVRTLAWLEEALRTPPAPNDAPETRAERDDLEREYHAARAGLLLKRLREREPDERIGYSLFVYHLSESDLDTLLRPVGARGGDGE